MWFEAIPSSAFLGCAACVRRIDLSLGTALVFAGVFGAWIFFRPQYEPGRGRNTLGWTLFGTLTFLPALAIGPALWLPFLGGWTSSLLVGVIRESRLPRESGSVPRVEGPSAPPASKGISFGFNASVLTFLALAVVLRLVTIRLASGSFFPQD